jgi:hypothetical protein
MSRNRRGRFYPLLAEVGKDVITGGGRGQSLASAPPLSLLGVWLCPVLTRELERWEESTLSRMCLRGDAVPKTGNVAVRGCVPALLSVVWRERPQDDVHQPYDEHPGEHPNQRRRDVAHTRGPFCRSASQRTAYPCGSHEYTQTAPHQDTGSAAACPSERSQRHGDPSR